MTKTIPETTWVMSNDDQKRILIAQLAELSGLADALPATFTDLTEMFDARILEITLYSLTAGPTPFVTIQDDTYRWTGPRSDGITLHALEMQRRWLQLPTTLKNGKPAGPLDPQFLGILTKTMESSAIRLMPSIVQFCLDHLPKTPGLRGLDIGGSHGLFSEALTHHGYQMSVVDLPPVVKISQPLLPNLHFIAADVVQEDIPITTPYDFALMIRFAHMHALTDIHTLAQHVHAALKPQATLILTDTIRGLSANADTFALNMGVNTPHGNSYSLEAIQEAFHPFFQLKTFETTNEDFLYYAHTAWEAL